jgi:hypothetical protein
MIWCLGMYASGSTWLYNATRQVAQIVHPQATVTGSYAETMAVLQRLPQAALNVVKTHDLDGAEAIFMATRAERIVVSIRDPRDAVVSMMQHMRHGFQLAFERVAKSAAFCAQLAHDPRAELFRYEDGFTETLKTFDRLAGMFGGALDEAARARLFARSRRAAIEQQIARLAELPTALRDPRSGDVLDSDTQWHLHHAGRTGEVGRWRQRLPVAAAVAIERRMGPWMRQFRYLP